MDMERPRRRNQTPWSTYFVLSSLSILSAVLIAAITILINGNKVKDNDKFIPFVTKVFRFHWFWVYIVLPHYLHGITVSLCDRYHVSYDNIHDKLTAIDFFLFGTGVLTLSLSTFYGHLLVKSGLKTPFLGITFSDFLPPITFGMVILILFCRCNRFYPATRSFFRGATVRAICAPFYEVTFADGFFVDQLTSQIEALRVVEMYICFYGFNDMYDVNNHCGQNPIFSIISLILGVLPIWTKFLQTFRRLLEETEKKHVFNCLKFLLTIVAVISRSVYLIHRSSLWMGLAIFFSLSATFLNMYWDLVVDWGLLERHVMYPYLRDHICIPYSGFYYGAMVTNILLRFVWIQILLKFDLSPLAGEIAIAIFSILEIVRRAIANFLKLEYEHVKNLGR